MAGVGFDDSVSDLLEGKSDVVGGLVVKKAPSKHVFRSPQGSILGLQKLAEEKKKRKEELEREEDAKKTKLSPASSGKSTADWEDNNSDGIDSRARFSSGSSRDDKSSKSRHYRSHLEETPTHTGGVSEEVREKQLRRMERDRDGRRGGVYAESWSRDRSNEEGRSKDRYSDGSKGSRYGDRDKRGYSSRGERSEARSKDRRSERERSRGREPSSRRSEWEETPDRSSRRGESEGSYTPRHKSEGLRTPSRTSWDDEESTPLRSKWDMASPARSITSDDMRSERKYGNCFNITL